MWCVDARDFVFMLPTVLVSCQHENLCVSVRVVSCRVYMNSQLYLKLSAVTAHKKQAPPGLSNTSSVFLPFVAF